MNRRFNGDNRHVLPDRSHFPDECVDLIYLDPPFNFEGDYNLLFKSPKGQRSPRRRERPCPARQVSVPMEAVSRVEAQPFQGKKKGADGGIDGIKFFRDLDKKDVRKLVVSVKGGENLKTDDVRFLMAARTGARDCLA